MNNRVFVRFCLLQGAYWAFQAAVMGYFTAYILDSGASVQAWGVILALNLLCAFLGTLFWGRWVDRRQASKAYFLLGNVSALVLSCLMYFGAGHMALVAALYPLLGFMTGAIPTVLDAWVIASFPERREAGPRARSCATLSYAIVMLLAGQLILRLGYGIMPVAALLSLGLSIAVALGQPEAKLSRSTAGVPEKASPRQLLSSRRYVLLVATLFFTGMCIAPINSMKIVVLESVGGDVALLGWDSFIGCVIQAQFLIFSKRLLKVPTGKRLAVGVIAPLCYALLVAVARNPAMIVLGTVMNNVSFGILYPTMREMTEASVPPSLRNTAHSAVDAAYGSFSGMIATFFSGFMLRRAGAAALGFTCAGLQVVAIGCCLLLLGGRGWRKPRPALAGSIE